MNKKKYYIFFATSITVLSVLLWSCSQEDNFESNKNEDNNKEIVDLGNITIDPIEFSRSTTNEIGYNLSFNDEDGNAMLQINLIENKNSNIFGCDVEKDGIIDFYIQPIGANMDEFYYLDKDMTIIQKCAFKKNSNTEFEMDVLEIYSNPNIDLYSRGESWSECFERRMGSTQGIIMTVTATVGLGNIGLVGVAIGGALSCAIWTPY